jgi:chromosome segregation ATPase
MIEKKTNVDTELTVCRDQIKAYEEDQARLLSALKEYEDQLTLAKTSYGTCKHELDQITALMLPARKALDTCKQSLVEKEKLIKTKVSVYKGVSDLYYLVGIDDDLVCANEQVVPREI